MRSQEPAILALTSGNIYVGNAWASTGRAEGPLFQSSTFSGYQNALAGQTASGKLALFSSPQIGNTGVSDAALPVSAAGVIVNEPARLASHFESRISLEETLTNARVVGISHVDTRSITRQLQVEGQSGIIISGSALQEVTTLISSPQFAGSLPGLLTALSTNPVEPSCQSASWHNSQLVQLLFTSLPTGQESK